MGVQPISPITIGTMLNFDGGGHGVGMCEDSPTHAHVNRAVRVFCRKLHFRLPNFISEEYDNINRDMDVQFRHVRLHEVKADVKPYSCYQMDSWEIHCAIHIEQRQRSRRISRSLSFRCK